MNLISMDLFCQSCGGYAHVFLDACPFCGGPRTSRLAEAAADPMRGRVALSGDAELREKAETLLRTTTLRSALQSGIGSALGEGRGAGHDEELDLSALVNLLTERMRYRAWPAAGQSEPVRDVRFLLEAERLRLSKERAPVGEVPLGLVLGISGPPDQRSGASQGAPRLVRTSERTRDQALLVAYATPDGVASVAIGNPPGLLATKARPDHYATLAWWLGVAAGLASARRWCEVGVAQHADELGIGPPADIASRA